MSAGTYWLWNGQQWLNEFTWSCADRALNYGDGLFETMRFDQQGDVPLWAFHVERIQQGVSALSFPYESFHEIEIAFSDLPATLRKGGGKLLISRGVGERGYAPAADAKVQLLWHSFDAPDWGVNRFPHGFKAEISPIKLAHQPLLAGIKHLNRLEQVLIRSRFSDGCQEAVVCDQNDQVVEGCMSNLFILKNGQLLTPCIENSGVNGVVRRWLIENHLVKVVALTFDDLISAEAMFFCNSLNGIVPVNQLGEHQYSQTHESWQIILKLQQKLEALFC